LRAAARSVGRGHAPNQSRHRTSAAAALLGVLTAVTLIGLSALGFFWAPVPDPSDRVLEWWVLAWVGFPLAGGLIAARRPDTRIGWVLIGMGVAMAAGRAGAIYATRAHDTLAGALPISEVGTVLLIVVATVADLGAFVLLGVALLLYPTDRLTKGWRRALPVVLGLGAVGSLGDILNPSIRLDSGSTVSNPLAGGTLAELAPLLRWVQIGIGLFLAAVLIDLIGRYRRADPVVRQQLKWLAYPAAVFLCAAVTFVLLVSEEAESFTSAVAWTVLFVVCFNGMAAAIALAVLRYRLYEIDRIVSRTVAYTVITAALVGVYAGGVVALGHLLAPMTRESEVAVAAATLLVAALFQPVRRRVQERVDRRFNRARYDAQHAVAEFAGHLRDEVDLDELCDELARVARKTVEPAAVSVWLRSGPGALSTSRSAAPAPPP
jgi:hypothetical protein